MAAHLHRWAGDTFDRDWHVYRVEYGALRSVYASTACNYSYREFWF